LIEVWLAMSSLSSVLALTSLSTISLEVRFSFVEADWKPEENCSIKSDDRQSLDELVQPATAMMGRSWLERSFVMKNMKFSLFCE
jgi:hypothetical protein